MAAQPESRIQKNLMVQRMVIMVFNFVFMVMLSCQSTQPDNTTDLDVTLKKQSIQDQVRPQNEKSEVQDQAVILTPDTVIKWQRFFKKPPSAEQRHVLARQLKEWKHDDDPKHLWEKAQKELALGRLTAALASLQQAARLKRDHNILLALAQVYLQLNKLTESLEVLTEIKKSVDKESPETIFRYRYLLALYNLKKNYIKEAQTILSELIQIEKSFAPAYIVLAQTYLQQGQYDTAEFVIKRGIDRSGQSAAFANLLGVVAQKRKNVYQAKKYFEQAIALDKTYAPALVNLGLLLIEEQKYESAEQILTRALTYDPSHVSAFIALGIVLRKMGRIKQAQEALEKALALDPLDPNARFNLALLYLHDKKEIGQATRLFHEVVQLSYKNPETAHLAKLYLEDLEHGPSSM